MREINEIIVHCSATPENMDIGVKEIRKWHTEERGFSNIGYHLVIRRDGEVEVGRPMKTPGAHAFGHNSYSIGICVVGGVHNDLPNFTMAQWEPLAGILTTLQAIYPEAEILGHRDLPNVTKACPGFDVRDWYKMAKVIRKSGG